MQHDIHVNMYMLIFTELKRDAHQFIFKLAVKLQENQRKDTVFSI